MRNDNLGTIRNGVQCFRGKGKSRRPSRATCCHFENDDCRDGAPTSQNGRIPPSLLADSCFSILEGARQNNHVVRCLFILLKVTADITHSGNDCAQGNLPFGVILKSENFSKAVLGSGPKSMVEPK